MIDWLKSFHSPESGNSNWIFPSDQTKVTLQLMRGEAHPPERSSAPPVPYIVILVGSDPIIASPPFYRSSSFPQCCAQWKQASTGVRVSRALHRYIIAMLSDEMNFKEWRQSVDKSEPDIAWGLKPGFLLKTFRASHPDEKLLRYAMNHHLFFFHKTGTLFFLPWTETWSSQAVTQA